jgi:hypothetical protein
MHLVAHRCSSHFRDRAEIPAIHQGNSEREDAPAVTRKKRFQVIARSRMTSASGFAWFAREPKLILGQRGAHPHRDLQNTTVGTGITTKKCPMI